MTVGGIVTQTLTARIRRAIWPHPDQPGTRDDRGHRGHLKRPSTGVLLALVLLLVAAATIVVGALVLRSRTYGGLAPACFVVGAFFFISAVVIPAGISREMAIEAEERDNCRRDCRRLKKALSAISEETLRQLMVANFKQMRTFTKIAQQQARMSYYASLIGASVSLLILAAGAAVTVGLTATPAKVTVGCLAGVGTALSVFLSRTFLRTYEMTSRQMSYYYGQPLVHCYLLHAEWLTAQVASQEPDQTERLKLWHKAIQASIRASANAQNHLLSLNENVPASRPAPRTRPAVPSWNDVLSQAGPPPEEMIVASPRT
jgi:hypothetical protein